MKKILIPSFIIVLIDQIVKMVINNNMELYSQIKVINHFFNITFVKNDGAAFSMFRGFNIIFIVVAIVILYFIFKTLKDKKIDKILMLCYTLLISGIVANLIDRIFRGYVIDYLDFYISKYHFPVFNLADICIVIGCIIFLFITIKEDFNEHHS